jgi:hypothetical protein
VFVRDETDGEGLPTWVTELGISDARTGREATDAARQRLLDAGRIVLSQASEYTTGHVVFSGLFARAQGLHEACASAADNENPYAAFTLLRAYAENAAAVLYLIDKPANLDRFWRGPGVPIGRITNHAQTRFAGFKAVYGELSKYAHPFALSILASHRVTDEADRVVEWSSVPGFRHLDEQLLAFGWTVELADATANLLGAFAVKFQLVTLPARLDEFRGPTEPL